MEACTFATKYPTNHGSLNLKSQSDVNCRLLCHKAQIFARGFEEQDGINFAKIFASTVRWESIRLVTCLATHHCWPIYYMDVAIDFLNGF